MTATSDGSDHSEGEGRANDDTEKRLIALGTLVISTLVAYVFPALGFLI